MTRINFYLKHWWLLAKLAFEETMVNRGTNIFFIIGKFLRLVFSLIFLLVLKSTTKDFGDYSTDQLIIFYLVYFYIDLISQTFLRGVYWFGQQLRSGQFDFWLIKPISPLFTALAGKPDINDALFFMPSVIISIVLLNHLEIVFNTGQIVWFFWLFLNGLLIATSLHIMILSAAILMIDVDGLMWLYRDVIRLGQFPISIYHESIRLALFFIIPIGVMITVPSQVLLGINPDVSFLSAILIGIGSLLLAKVTWSFSLKKYTSASS